MNTTFFVYNLGGAAGSTDVPVEPAVLISAARWQLQSVKLSSDYSLCFIS